ncbi:hypothetical protein BDF14DRAFT_1882830 [Spinellus fusiger]|nr:hypothetical protein BDF14DRAFT_1882830 [Spinellus fusiger]
MTHTLVHDQSLINVHFEGYKLKTLDENTQLSRTPLPQGQLQVSLHHSIGFRELQARVRFSHLAYGYPLLDTGYAFYVDNEYNVIMVAHQKNLGPSHFYTLSQLARPLQVSSKVESDTLGPLPSHYPSLAALSPYLLLATNGVGDIEVLSIDYQHGIQGVSLGVVHYEGEGTEGVSPVPCTLLSARQCEDKVWAVVYSRAVGQETQFNISMLEITLPTTTEPMHLRLLYQHKGSQVPVYCAITSDGRCMLGSECSFGYSKDVSETTPLLVSASSPPPPPPLIAPYRWTQQGQEICVEFKLAPNTLKSDIHCKLTHQHLSLMVQSEDSPIAYPYSKLWGTIDDSESIWTFTSDKLSLFITKQDEYTRWPHLFDKDDQVPESLDAQKLADMTERLAKFTTDMPDSIRHPTATDMDMEEDVDEAGQPIRFVVYDKEGQCVQEIASGGREWIGNSFGPDLPSVAVKMDIDAPVFQWKEGKDLQSQHVATLNAFAFVHASKQDSRFVRHDPQNTFSVIVESSRNAYIYYNTGRNTERQTLVDLTQGHDISVLGVQLVMEGVLMVLTEADIVVIHLDSQA